MITIVKSERTKSNAKKKKYSEKLSEGVFKIAHTADLHIGALRASGYPYYLDRTQLMLDEFLESIQKHKPDLIVIAGDVLEVCNPTPEELTQFSDFVAHLEDIAIPSLIVPGNHERKRNGNTAIQHIESFNDIFSYVEICHKVCKRTIKGVTVVVFPDDYENNLKAAGNAMYGTSKEGQQESDMQALVELESHLKGAHVAVAHYAAKGCVYENGMESGSVNLNYDDLNPVLWCLGDIHKAQEIKTQSKAVWYCGSPYQKNFGEKLPKGYMIHSLNPKQWEGKIPTKADIQTQFVPLNSAPALVNIIGPNPTILKKQLTEAYEQNLLVKFKSALRLQDVLDLDDPKEKLIAAQVIKTEIMNSTQTFNPEELGKPALAGDINFDDIPVLEGLEDVLVNTAGLPPELVDEAMAVANTLVAKQ